MVVILLRPYFWQNVLHRNCYSRSRNIDLTLTKWPENNRKLITFVIITSVTINTRRVNLPEKTPEPPNKLLQKVFQWFLVVFDIKNNVLKVLQNPKSGKP